MVFKVNAQQVQLVNKPDDRKVDVLIDEELFTSYIYPETMKKTGIVAFNLTRGA